MQFLKILLQTFAWIIIIVHCCLLVWLTYVRILETVNNGFLWYSIPWWYEVFHFLENINLWKQFVALHCFDTRMNNFLLVMGFKALYLTLVHWLKNRHCIWSQENQADVHEVLDFRVSNAIVNQKGNLSALSSKGWVDFSYPLFKTPVIQLFFCTLYQQGSCFTFLKHHDFLDLPTTNISNFSPVALAVTMPANLTLMFLLPEDFLPDRW